VANITVGSTAALSSALLSAHDGDTILLAPGTYNNVTYAFNNLNFANGITITSADPSNPATITTFIMQNSSGITFSNLTMQTQATGYFDFQVYTSNNIHFDHVSVHGSMDGNPQDDIEGISINTSTNVSITNSEFQQLERAMAFSSSNNIVVANNNVHDVEVTGVGFAQVGNVLVDGNTFSNFDPVVGVDHPDAIQFLTAGTTAPSHDITITNNAIFRGTGGATQGIFFRDQLTTMNYQNVTIANNLIDGTGYGGILADYTHNISVTGNTLITLAGASNNTPLQIFDSSGVIITNNQTAGAIGIDGDTALTQSGNTLNAIVTDGGAAALQTWLAAHPNTGIQGTPVPSAPPVTIVAPTPVAPVSPPPPPPPAPGVVFTGTSANDHLVGTAGNDTLNGNGGADTLAGGAGDDTYIIPNSSAQVVEAPGGGNDTVIAKGSYTLPANVENLVINSTVTNSWAGYGNTLNNQITGNAGDNSLDGGAGADTLSGGAGADTLFGGLGDDRLTGGTGGDSFRFVPGGGHDVITDYGNGADRIDISAYQKAGLTPTLTNVGGNLVISFTDGDSITVLGHQAADMHIWHYGWAI
jgi:Ca2+-binding RTX toxin-like protein